MARSRNGNDLRPLILMLFSGAQPEHQEEPGDKDDREDAGRKRRAFAERQHQGRHPIGHEAEAEA